MTTKLNKTGIGANNDAHQTKINAVQVRIADAAIARGLMRCNRSSELLYGCFIRRPLPLYIVSCQPTADIGDFFLYTGHRGAVVPFDVVRLRIHPSVTFIPAKAFKDLKKLEEVELNEGLQKIGKSAFCGCVKLRRMRVPSTVAFIGGWAFYKCSKLNEVKLCEGLQEIGEYAFAHCIVLRRMRVPSTVKKIGGFAR